MEIVKDFIKNLNGKQMLFIVFGTLIICVIFCIIMEVKNCDNIGVILFPIIMLATMLFLLSTHDKLNKNNDKYSKNDFVIYHFIEEPYISKEQSYIRLVNDKNNDVDIVYKIHDKNDKLIYTSSKISPGTVFYWKAYDYLKEGPTELNMTIYYYDNKKSKNNKKPFYCNIEEIIYKDYDPFYNYAVQY